LLPMSESAFADQSMLMKERFACAETGADPTGRAFAQCIADLEQSLMQEQSLAGR
jgi:hypothetical protein